MMQGELERTTLPVLLAWWARIVDVVARGDMAPADFRHDLQVRHEIAQRIRSRPVTAETRELLAELDGWLREATVASPECVWGSAQAAEHGWLAARQWYYWRALRAHSPDDVTGNLSPG